VRNDTRSARPIAHPIYTNGDDLEFIAHKKIPSLFQTPTSPALKSGKSCYIKLEGWVQIPRCRLRQFNYGDSFDNQPRLDYKGFKIVYDLLKAGVPSLSHIDSRELYKNATAGIIATMSPPPQVAVPSSLQALAPAMDIYKDDIFIIWNLVGKIVKENWYTDLTYQSVNEMPQLYAFDRGNWVVPSSVVVSVLVKAYRRYGIGDIARTTPTKMIVLAMAYNKDVDGYWHPVPQEQSTRELSACGRVVTNLLRSNKQANKICIFVLRSVTMIFLNELVLCISSIKGDSFRMVN
jgi:hypothetical protein